MKQNLIDIAKFSVQAGNGGSGKISFRREKYVAKGGPDGGDGGNGGSIYIVSSSRINTLNTFAGVSKIEAQNGGAGSKAKRHGANAQDIIINVPTGTIIYEKKENNTYDLLADLENDNQKFLLAKGGKGGRGNWHFKNSKQTTPMIAEPGERGEKREIKLELKILAQIGLVGFPNAGKSTLLSILTKAKPQIAGYPFTTLSPNLGVLTSDISKSDHRINKQSLVIADIPGIIKGAHEGKGLGVKFLKHIERCQLIIHVLFPQANQINLSNQKLSALLFKQFKDVSSELKNYSQKLINPPFIVVVNKIDLLTEDQINSIKKYFAIKNQKAFFISSITNKNIKSLKESIIKSFNKIAQ